jgi:hypothetical protein
MIAEKLKAKGGFVLTKIRVWSELYADLLFESLPFISPKTI